MTKENNQGKKQVKKIKQCKLNDGQLIYQLFALVLAELLPW